MCNPNGSVSLHLVSSGIQSQCRIWFILPAHGACHIIIVIIIYVNTNEIPGELSLLLWSHNKSHLCLNIL